MIEIRLAAHVGIRQIGRDLRRDHGVISKEVDRNSMQDGRYSATQAQNFADGRVRQRRKRKRKLDIDADLREHVVQELKKGRSPDVIAGRLKYDPPPHLKGKTISTEAIYQWIQEGEGRHLGLHHFLLSGRPRRQKRGGRKKQKTHIPERISIHERPEGIEARKEAGHWESDSMVFSKQRERLSVQYERKSRYVMIHRLSDGSADETDKALMQSIESLPQPLWKTITFDNGGEGANHWKLRAYGIATYHCDTYASYQKGGVENTNRVIRRYLPRMFDLSSLTDYDLVQIQQSINSTPRKILGYRTPEEVLRAEGVVH